MSRSAEGGGQLTLRASANLSGAERHALSRMTDAEREVFVAVEGHGVGVRALARKTGRKPGTVGNLLARARAKVPGEQ